MKYFIDDKEVKEEEFYERLEEAVNDYVAERYDDLIDETYPEVQIGSCSFYPSRILKELDPIAYRCGIDDFADAYISNYKYEFKEENIERINGTYFETKEEEEEE